MNIDIWSVGQSYAIKRLLVRFARDVLIEDCMASSEYCQFRMLLGAALEKARGEQHAAGGGGGGEGCEDLGESKRSAGEVITQKTCITFPSLGRALCRQVSIKAVAGNDRRPTQYHVRLLRPDMSTKEERRKRGREARRLRVARSNGSDTIPTPPAAYYESRNPLAVVWSGGEGGRLREVRSESDDPESTEGNSTSGGSEAWTKEEVRIAMDPPTTTMPKTSSSL
eukprot:TRINITY_DN22731_c0_g1_i2.p2 TRINITY_DN22731_c0_g1~~TRINITY_DN22731_c0_g1_i2.p2  ORF type:complete len:225 (-),score=39.67 TRINITY_DN22731_c0_g1_i2:360-1034(-)